MRNTRAWLLKICGWSFILCFKTVAKHGFAFKVFILYDSRFLYNQDFWLKRRTREWEWNETTKKKSTLNELFNVFFDILSWQVLLTRKVGVLQHRWKPMWKVILYKLITIYDENRRDDSKQLTRGQFYLAQVCAFQVIFD